MIEPGIVLRDSVTKTEPGDTACVLVTGSHGGLYAASLAARIGDFTADPETLAIPARRIRPDADTVARV